MLDTRENEEIVKEDKWQQQHVAKSESTHTTEVLIEVRAKREKFPRND